MRDSRDIEIDQLMAIRRALERVNEHLIKQHDIVDSLCDEKESVGYTCAINDFIDYINSEIDLVDGAL